MKLILTIVVVMLMFDSIGAVSDVDSQSIEDQKTKWFEDLHKLLNEVHSSPSADPEDLICLGANGTCITTADLAEHLNAQLSAKYRLETSDYVDITDCLGFCSESATDLIGTDWIGLEKLFSGMQKDGTIGPLDSTNSYYQSEDTAEKAIQEFSERTERILEESKKPKVITEEAQKARELFDKYW